MRKEDYEETERERPRKKKKKGHKLYAFIVLILGLAIIALSVLLLFYVQEIKVSGNEYCTDKEIKETVQNDRYSINTLYILGKYALGYGEELPCLESMKISMKAPWSLQVTVKEKPIVGYVTTGSEYAYFDKEGMVVLKGTTYIEGLPSIEGIDVTNVALYEKLESEDAGIFEEILETTEEVNKYNLDTDKIVCTDGKIYLYIGTVCVNLGSSVSSEQIAQISPIMEKLEGKSGTLHLENFSEGNTTITFNIEEDEEEN